MSDRVEIGIDAELFKSLVRALEQHIPGIREDITEDLDKLTKRLIANGKTADAEAMKEVTSQPFFKRRKTLIG